MHTTTLVYGLLATAVSHAAARAVPASILFRRHTAGTEGDCSVLPLGSGPTPSPDTPEAFLADSYFSSAALGAGLPAGYSVVLTNSQAAITDPSYITFEYETTYDPSVCAKRCTNDIVGCKSFNIYFERDPTVDPGVNCPNPPSTTQIKCAYFGAPVTATEATNSGQVCANFHIVIAGSNAYNVVAPATSSTTTTAAVTTTAAATTTAAPTTSAAATTSSSTTSASTTAVMTTSSSTTAATSTTWYFTSAATTTSSSSSSTSAAATTASTTSSSLSNSSSSSSTSVSATTSTSSSYSAATTKPSSANTSSSSTIKSTTTSCYTTANNAATSSTISQAMTTMSSATTLKTTTKSATASAATTPAGVCFRIKGGSGIVAGKPIAPEKPKNNNENSNNDHRNGNKDDDKHDKQGDHKGDHKGANNHEDKHNAEDNESHLAYDSNVDSVYYIDEDSNLVDAVSYTKYQRKGGDQGKGSDSSSEYGYACAENNYVPLTCDAPKGDIGHSGSLGCYAGGKPQKYYANESGKKIAFSNGAAPSSYAGWANWSQWSQVDLKWEVAACPTGFNPPKSPKKSS